MSKKRKKYDCNIESLKISTELFISRLTEIEGYLLSLNNNDEKIAMSAFDSSHFKEVNGYLFIKEFVNISSYATYFLAYGDHKKRRYKIQEANYGFAIGILSEFEVYLRDVLINIITSDRTYLKKIQELKVKLSLTPTEIYLQLDPKNREQGDRILLYMIANETISVILRQKKNSLKSLAKILDRSFGDTTRLENFIYIRNLIAHGHGSVDIFRATDKWKGLSFHRVFLRNKDLIKIITNMKSIGDIISTDNNGI